MINEIIKSKKKGINKYSQINEALEDGVSPDELDDRNTCAVFNAVSEKEVEVVELLLRKGANPNIQDISGVTPLMKACLLNDQEIVNVLIEYYADPYLKQTRGNDAFYYDKTGLLDEFKVVERLGTFRKFLNL